MLTMSLLQQLLDSITSDVKRFTKLKFDIADAVMMHLENENKTQKDLAQQLGKSESEISKWLSGQHNLTLKSIARMEDALGIEIINVQIPQRLNEKEVNRFRTIAQPKPSLWKLVDLNRGDVRASSFEETVRTPEATKSAA
jgi:transcriptional regulator with XRE-family HTH domain